MKVHQVMLTHWEAQRLLALLDADPSFNNDNKQDLDPKLYNKLLDLKSRFTRRAEKKDC